MFELVTNCDRFANDKTRPILSFSAVAAGGEVWYWENRSATVFPVTLHFIKSGGCCGGEQWFGIISGDTHKEIW